MVEVGQGDGNVNLLISYSHCLIIYLSPKKSHLLKESPFHMEKDFFDLIHLTKIVPYNIILIVLILIYLITSFTAGTF